MLPADAVRAEAGRLGFMACGITHPGPVPHATELDDWLERGYAGTMRYLHRQAARRKEPQRIVPEARSVVVVLDNYGSTPPPATGPRIARYARGRDYHDHMGSRLRELSAWLCRSGASVARPYVDAGPVPERELAQRAGLGWIGKNTMLIRPGAGSWFFIGAIFTDLPLAADQPFTTDHCGSCTRCLEACPTGALVEPRVLDATRCISYLTIEYRGPFAPDQEQAIGEWAFGCDICNEVCPWNERFATAESDPAYAEGPDWSACSVEGWEGMDHDEFERRFGGTPIMRTGLSGMRRNWNAALGRRGPAQADPDSPLARKGD